MDKNPKHPLKKKKAVQKVYATANHNAAAAEEPATPKSKKHKQRYETKVPRICERQVWGTFFVVGTAIYKFDF